MDFYDNIIRLQEEAWSMIEKREVIDHPHPSRIAGTPLLSDKPDLSNLEMTINQAVTSQYIAITPEDSLYPINHIATRQSLAPITKKSPEIKLEQNPNNKQYYLSVKSQGFWLNNPSTLDYQWYIDDVGQFGEYSSVLNVYPKDNSKQFRCNVRATNAHGSTIAPSNTLRISFPKEIAFTGKGTASVTLNDDLPESQQFWSKAAELAVKDINEFERDLGLNKTWLGFDDTKISLVPGIMNPIWDDLWLDAAEETIAEMGKVVPLCIERDKIILDPNNRWISQTDQKLLEQKDESFCINNDTHVNDTASGLKTTAKKSDDYVAEILSRRGGQGEDLIDEMKRNRRVNLKLSKCNICNGYGFDNEQGLCIKCGWDLAYETLRSINSNIDKRNLTQY